MKFVTSVILFIAATAFAYAVYVNDHSLNTVLESPVATSTPIDEGTSTIEHVNDALGFSIVRPKTSEIQTGNFDGYLSVTQTPVIGVTLAHEMFTGTNLSDVGVYIGASSSKSVLASCLKASKDTDEKAASSTLIGTTQFATFTSVGVGAGNTYEEKTYRALHDGRCYEIAELLHSGNIGNYPDGTVVQFDHAKFSGYLEDIAKTFVFTK